MTKSQNDKFGDISAKNRKIDMENADKCQNGNYQKTPADACCYMIRD